MSLRAVCRIALVSLVFIPLLAAAYTSPGKPQGHVSDFAGILSAQTKAGLESNLSHFAEASSTEIAVATVKSLNGDDIAPYANELFREWGIGKKGVNNGVLLLVAPNERKVRIEVGYGLEGVLTDLQSGYIIDNIITPEFKKGDYDAGVTLGVHAIESVVQGEAFDTSKGNKSGQSSSSWEVAIVFLIAGFWLLQFFGAILARSKSWWAGGILGIVPGIIVGLVFGFLYAGIIALVGSVLLGLLFDYFVSKTYKSHKSAGQRIPWYIGGNSGFGSGGSGGFGGFGGGSSGGGGASGGW